MERKELRSPVVYTLIRNVTIAILSFISFPFATQALGSSALGVYSWANTFVYYFLILSRLGIPLIATRECAKVADNKGELSKKVQSFFVLQLITTAASFILLLLVVFLGRGVIVQEELISLIFLLSINFLVGVFSFEWVYIALGKIFYISLRSLIFTLISTLLIIVFVQNDHNLYIYAFINILTTILTVITNIFFLKSNNIRFSLKNKIEFKTFSKSLLTVFAITLLITVYNQSDSLLLGYLDPSQTTTGSYAVGVRGVEIVITIITSLSSVFVIQTTKAAKANDMVSFNKVVSYSTNIIFFIGIPAVLYMIGLSTHIVNFIVSDSPYWTSQAIEGAKLAVIILSSLMLTYSLHDSIYQQVLVPLNKEKVYFLTMACVLVFNISMSIISALFIFPNNILFAVALVTLISEIITLTILFVATRKLMFKHIFNLNNLKIIIACGVSLTIVMLGLPLLPTMEPLTTLLLSLLTGGIIYIVILALLKEDIVVELLSGAKNG